MAATPMNEPNGGPTSSSWPVYGLFGVNLASDFPFASRLMPTAGAPDLVFTCVQASELPSGWENLTPAYASHFCTDGGESVAYLYPLDTCDVLRFTRVADFCIRSERLTCHLLDPDRGDLVEIHLLGPVLSFWLERQGIPALHASSVIVEGRSVVFLSSSRGGKSTVAAALVQAGYPLLSDDILPVEEHHGMLVGRPGYPQMRLWPEEAAHFLGHYENLELVHPLYSKRRVPVGPGGFGSFCGSPHPLACIYVPERSGPADERTGIEIMPISPRDAVIELVRHSFSARVVEAVGLQPQRLQFFARFARQVPMRRITYPSGFQQLSRIRDEILKDLRTLP